MKNYVRFNVTTDDPELSFLIDCRKGEDILGHAIEVVERWCRITDTVAKVAGVAFVCAVRY